MVTETPGSGHYPIQTSLLITMTEYTATPRYTLGLLRVGVRVIFGDSVSLVVPHYHRMAVPCQ